MNFLNTLPSQVDKAYKRRGRGLGSGRGSKSGRGTTRHQTARTTMPLHFEGGQGRIVKKYPLMRGKSQNRAISPKAYVVPLSQLANCTEDVTVDFLIKNNLVPSDALTVGVKVLLDKPITKAITLAVSASASVKLAVTNAGGKILSLS